MLKRMVIAGSALGVVVALAMGVWGFGFQGASTADAQATDLAASDMQQRLDQLVQLINNGGPAGGAAIDEAMEVLYGGFRVLPSPGDEQTEQWHRQTSANEMKVARALENFATKPRKANDDDVQRAVDMKFFVEQMNDVARAVANATRQCGEGSILLEPPCEELQVLLDEEQGRENVVGQAGQLDLAQAVHPGYSVKLRSPFVPGWTNRWDEDVQVTEPIANGECAVVFKETKGLMLRLYYDRVITVSDPWATPQLPRGTKIPVWRMEWVPSEYVKTFNLCNQGGRVVKTVAQQVVQDVPLKYFWRFYGK